MFLMLHKNIYLQIFFFLRQYIGNKGRLSNQEPECIVIC